jgi:hypothetical protein
MVVLPTPSSSRSNGVSFLHFLIRFQPTDSAEEPVFLAARLLSGEGLLGSLTASSFAWSVAFFAFAWISGVALLIVLGIHARKERRLA